MTKHRVVVSLPNENAYQHAQAMEAKEAAAQLGMEIEVLVANDDAITQSQQLLEIIQSKPEKRPDAFVAEPVTANALQRVAEEAVKAGMGWVLSNSEVDYIEQLRKNAKVPVFIVTQGQMEIGRLQAKQMETLLPKGGSVLYVMGPSMSAVAAQRRDGMESLRPRNIHLTALRSKWGIEGAQQSVGAWMKMATSRAEKFDLVAGHSHELVLGAKAALLSSNDPKQKQRWKELAYLGIGILAQVKPLVDGRELTGAVVSSLTMNRALGMLERALVTKQQPSALNMVEATVYPRMEELAARRMATEK